MCNYCLIPDVARLREKLTSATGDLQHYWRWMQQCARHAPAEYPWYQPFCAVVTGEACYAMQARQVLLDFTARLPERDATIFVQYHHWAAAAPMARYGLYYDWIADLAPFTDSERERISDALLDYGVKHVLPSLQTKHQSDENNQVLSLALSATMLGWVYGRRRGPSAAGDALLQYGLQRLMVLMDQLPVGGYSGEGSAYMGQIFAPALIFAAELLREITGEAWLTRPAHATGVSVLDVVRMTARNITPGGLWLPWDHHGFYVAQNYLSLAVLARETGEADWLAIPRATRTWGYEQNMLWGYDDKVWTLLWWPDDLAVPDAPAWRPWLRPEVAGAVVSRDAAVQMVQAWDICGDTGLSSSRMHVNPNTLLCEAFGAPLTMDGSPTSDCTAIKIPGCSQTVHYFGPPTTTDWSSGMVGAHSCVLVDGEAGYLTEKCVHGEGLCLAELPGFQAVSADATAFYAPRYDAEQVIRTTMLLDDRLLLVTDAVRFASPHTLTWRAYLRPEAQVGVRCVQQRTAEGVQAEWQFPAADGVTVTEIPGFPNMLEQRSARVDVAYASAQEHQLVSLIYPQQALAEVAALDGAWHFRADAANVGVRDGWWQPGDAWDTALCLDISLPWPAFGGDAASRFGWYARAVTITAEATPTRLRLHRFFGQEYRVWWDGQELPIAGVPLVAPYVTLPAAAPGAHWLVLRACHQGMTFTQDDRITTGYARRDTFSGIPALQAPGDVLPTPALSALDAHWLRVAGSLVLHDNHVAAHQSCDGWRTDARHARLTAEDAWALVDATFVQLGEALCCTADVPVTLSWQSDTLTLGAVPPGGACTVYVPGATLRCARAGGLQWPCRAAGVADGVQP